MKMPTLSSIGIRRTGLLAFIAILMLFIAEAAIGASAARPEVAMGQGDWWAIKAAIRSQTVALKAQDAKRAFAFATPAMQAQLQTPESFMAMVQTGYEALLTARYTEFLEGAVIEGRVIQPMRLVAPDNTVLVAFYTMERQRDGTWRIAGCALAPSSVQAT
ncbi:MAG: DUF4864 domain-containing protein [Betaproteobacteria bacterium]